MDSWGRGILTTGPFTIDLTIEDVLADLDAGFLPAETPVEEADRAEDER